jgi:hypothetical protein
MCLERLTKIQHKMNLNLENINLGTTTGDKTGDGAKTGGGKINRNFAKIKAFLETPDIILIQNGYNLAGQNLTFLAGWEWRIETVVYTNPANVVVNFPFASSRKQRIDLVVATSSNTFLRVPGLESVENPVAPLVPNGSLYVSLILVNDAVIGTPSTPIAGDNFISKISQSPRRSYDNGIIDLENETRIILYTCTEINYINHLILGQAYDGRQLFITNENEDESDIVINNLFNHKGNFSFPNAIPFVLKFKETIHTKLFYDFGNKVTYLYVGIIRDQISDIENLETELADRYTKSEADVLLANKLDASAYNQHFKGVYLTEAALNAAHPTASIGDYAQVNETGATDVVNYNWDAEENIWVKNAVAGSGATNTDALPEGASNLYFTVARFLSNLTYANVISALGFTPSTAPNNAQKNSDITKAEIEAKLTGEITTHTHSVNVLPVIEIGTNTTLNETHNGRTILITASCTITLPNGLSNGYEVALGTLAGATMTLALGGSVTLFNNTGLTLAEKLTATIKRRIATDHYYTAGNL